MSTPTSLIQVMNELKKIRKMMFSGKQTSFGLAIKILETSFNGNTYNISKFLQSDSVEFKLGTLHITIDDNIKMLSPSEWYMLHDGFLLTSSVYISCYDLNSLKILSDISSNVSEIHPTISIFGSTHDYESIKTICFSPILQSVFVYGDVGNDTILAFCENNKIKSFGCWYLHMNLKHLTSLSDSITLIVHDHHILKHGYFFGHELRCVDDNVLIAGNSYKKYYLNENVHFIVSDTDEHRQQIDVINSQRYLIFYIMAFVALWVIIELKSIFS